MKVLITGANGYVGRYLVNFLRDRHEVVAVTRSPFNFGASVKNELVNSLANTSRWEELLVGVDVVVHLAARVHVLKDRSVDSLKEFRETNVVGTVSVARAAIAQGVKRFVFVSSIGVLGDENSLNSVLSTDTPQPSTDYAKSKWEAEEELRILMELSNTELAIVRPPMIYGPGAPGNMSRLIRLIETKLPLPFGAVTNKRTLVSIDNLMLWMELIIESDACPSRPILVGDPEPVSTTDILSLVGAGRREKVRQFRVPVRVLEMWAGLAKMKSTMKKLTRDFEISVSFDLYPEIKNDLQSPVLELYKLGRHSAGGETTASESNGQDPDSDPLLERSVVAKHSGRRILYGITVGTGAFSYHRGQLAWFKQQGWQVILATIDDGPARIAASREGVRHIPINMVRDISPREDIPSLIAWFKLIHKLRPDVTNLSTPKASLLGGVAAWVLRVPRRVYIVRGLRVEGANGPLGTFLWLAEWMTQWLATDVVYVSKSLASEAERRRLLPRARTWLIGNGSSNGVDAGAITKRIASSDPTKLRDQLDIPRDSIVVGFVGRLTRDKGIDALLQVVESPELDPNCKFLVIGPVEDATLASRLGELEGRVYTTGWTDDVWGYLPTIDILLLPTHREGFPNVVLEAAVAGVPSITTNATGAVDSVVHGSTGYITDVDDSAEMVRRINCLVKDPSQRQMLGIQARVRAEREFKPELVWEGLQSVSIGSPDPSIVVNIKKVLEEGQTR